MTVNVNKVTHYNVSMNLTQDELNVFYAIMSNLKSSEVCDAFGPNTEEQKDKIIAIYNTFKSIPKTNIEMGN